MPPLTRLDDPEKGAMTTVTLHPVADALPSALPTAQVSSAEFKVNSTTVDGLRAQILSIGESPKPPSRTSKRKVGRRIRFALWFNTYRFVTSVYPKKHIV
jgi:hypothetical protein